MQRPYRKQRPAGMTLPEAFRYYMPDDPPDEGCWEWAGGTRDWCGYGILSHSESPTGKVRAHRLSYEIFIGPIPEGNVIRHTCDNPPCVNPNHLVPGTQAQNVRDSVERRRWGHRGEKIQGSRHYSTRLTESDVLEIRRLCAEGVMQTELARKYGVCDGTINMIAARKTWKHI